MATHTVSSRIRYDKLLNQTIMLTTHRDEQGDTIDVKRQVFEGNRVDELHQMLKDIGDKLELKVEGGFVQ